MYSSFYPCKATSCSYLISFYATAASLKKQNLIGSGLLLQAIAGEAGVPFFYRAGSEFEEM